MVNFLIFVNLKNSLSRLGFEDHYIYRLKVGDARCFHIISNECTDAY